MAKLKRRKKNGSSNSANPGRLWLMRAFLIIIPLLFFAGTELLLRLADYGHGNRLFEPVPGAPGFLRVIPDFGKRYFPSGRFFPKAPQEYLKTQKEPDSFRIVVLGGSSARGYPYDYNGSFSSMLRQLLKQSHPGMKVEILNLAMVAVNSYAVLDLAKKIIPYQPDLVLIYTGHNEFYGALGSGSVESLGRQRWMVKLHLALENLRFYQFFRSVIFKVGALAGKPAEAPPNNATLMEQMAARKQIAYGSPLFRRTYQIFAANLRETVKILTDNGIHVALSTISSNVKDQKPFLSIFRDENSKKSWHQFEKEVIREDTLPKKDVLNRLEEFSRNNPLAAAPLYFKGKLLLQKKNGAAASAALFKAKDLDGLRFRAAETANSIIESVCRATPALMVDVANAFKACSPDGIPGNELFLEHLHPNLFGYYLIAKTFYQTLADSGWLPPAERPLPPDSLYKSTAGVTDFDEQVGKIRIQVLKSGWPFQNRAAGQLSQIPINPEDPVEKAALQFWRNEITWEEAHVKLGNWFLKNGQLEKAAREFEALKRFTPFNPSPYRELLKIYTPTRQWEKLELAARELLLLKQDPLAFRSLGVACYATGRAEEAEKHLLKVKALAPEDIIGRFYLAATQLALGKVQSARQEVQFIRARNPGLLGLDQLEKRLDAAERMEKN